MNYEIIERKINFVKELLVEAKEYLTDYENEENKKDRLALERLTEEIVETSIKINKELLKIKKIIPMSYKESFLKLEKFKIFKIEILELLADTAIFRNELAHDYMDMSSNFILLKI